MQMVMNAMTKRRQLEPMSFSTQDLANHILWWTVAVYQLITQLDLACIWCACMICRATQGEAGAGREYASRWWRRRMVLGTGVWREDGSRQEIAYIRYGLSAHIAIKLSGITDWVLEFGWSCVHSDFFVLFSYYFTVHISIYHQLFQQRQPKLWQALTLTVLTDWQLPRIYSVQPWCDCGCTLARYIKLSTEHSQKVDKSRIMHWLTGCPAVSSNSVFKMKPLPPTPVLSVMRAQTRAVSWKWFPWDGGKTIGQYSVESCCLCISLLCASLAAALRWQPVEVMIFGSPSFLRLSSQNLDKISGHQSSSSLDLLPCHRA